MSPTLSRESWLAAQSAAGRAIPVLLAHGRIREAELLMRRAKQFASRAAIVECSSDPNTRRDGRES